MALFVRKWSKQCVHAYPNTSSYGKLTIDGKWLGYLVAGEGGSLHCADVFCKSILTDNLVTRTVFKTVWLHERLNLFIGGGTK